MDPANYFDNAATTRLCDAARQSMLPWLGDHFGNPHSLHGWGHAANHAVESARSRIATLLELEDPSQLVFTSGATEACNTMVALCNPDRSAVSPFEHSAVRVAAARAGIPTIINQGFELPLREGITNLVTCCSNETGALFSADGGWFCDATQSVGKVPVDFSKFAAAAFSAHKFGGPMGVGALYLQEPTQLSEFNAMLVGGGHESGRRAGTLNVPGIVGMAAALEDAHSNPIWEHVAVLRIQLKTALGSVPGIRFVESPNQSPFILSVVVPGLAAQPLVEEVARMGFGISGGAACSSGSTEPSPVLMALGLTHAEAMSTIRISFGRDNTADSTDALAGAIVQAIRQIRG